MSAPRKYQHLKPFNRTVVLVGMMGAGKTTVGRRLAPQLGLPFFDADAEIEKAASMSVSELFASHGEESFRTGEEKVIERLLDGPPHVLATGGGAFARASTRALVKQKGISIWLKADIDTVVRRATRRDARPLLKTGDPHEIISKLMKERTDFYAEADLHIESQPGPHANTVDVILEALEAHVSGSRETEEGDAK